MIAEYINRFEQFGTVTYDLLLKEDEVIKHRFNVKFTVENDTQENRDALILEKELAVETSNRLAYVNAKMNVLKARLAAGLDQQMEQLRVEILLELYGISD